MVMLCYSLINGKIDQRKGVLEVDRSDGGTTSRAGGFAAAAGAVDKAAAAAPALDR